MYLINLGYAQESNQKDDQTQNQPPFKKISLVPKETLIKHFMKPTKLGLLNVGIRQDYFTYQDNPKYESPLSFGLGFASTPLGNIAVWRSLTIWLNDTEQFQVETMVWFPIPKFTLFGDTFTASAGLRLGIQDIKANDTYDSGYGYYNYNFSSAEYVMPDPFYFGLSYGYYSSYFAVELDLDFTQMTNESYYLEEADETEMKLSRVGIKALFFL